MKTIIHATMLFLFCFSLTTNSQTLESKIGNIRSKYDLITKAVRDSAYKIRSIKFDCPDYPAYGSLTFYSEGSALKMIELDNDDGSHGGETQQYFIWNRKLIFCYIEGSAWAFDFDSSQDTSIIDNDTIYRPQTIDNSYEKRYYFFDNKPIRCLSKEFQTRSSGENGQSSETPANEKVDCDTENIKSAYSNLLKLNSIIIKKAECPEEILNILNNQ